MLPHIGNEKVFQLYAMAISLGKLEEFDTANGDDWVLYIEHITAKKAMKDEIFGYHGVWQCRKVGKT